jgi:hypothetical protein
MRKLGVFTALALTGMTVSCAERVMRSDAIPKPAVTLEAIPKPRPNNVQASPQAQKVEEDSRRHSSIRPRQVSPSSSLGSEQPPQPEVPPQASHRRQQALIQRELPAAAALPPPLEPDESNFPFEVLMPPPPEPAEPTFPSVPPTVELPPPSDPAAPALPEMPIESAMPPPPEAAHPSFPVAALLPPLPEPAEPSLPSQKEIIAESPIPIPIPDLPAPLSLHPRLDWGDVTGSFEIPRSPSAQALEASRKERIPSLIRNPWPLAMDAP